MFHRFHILLQKYEKKTGRAKFSSYFIVFSNVQYFSQIQSIKEVDNKLFSLY